MIFNRNTKKILDSLSKPTWIWRCSPLDKNKKTYLIQADMGEGTPFYTFMILAKNKKEAEKLATKEVMDYHGEKIAFRDDIDMYVTEIKTLQDVYNCLFIKI